MAQALRQGVAQLRNQDEGQQVASIAEGAADRVERLGGYLERTSGDELLRDVENFARRRPWMVASIGFVAGIAASRFLKASSERRYGSRARQFEPVLIQHVTIATSADGRRMTRAPSRAWRRAGERDAKSQWRHSVA